jgi:hypothetical protein
MNLRCEAVFFTSLFTSRAAFAGMKRILRMKRMKMLFSSTLQLNTSAQDYDVLPHSSNK